MRSIVCVPVFALAAVVLAGPGDTQPGTTYDIRPCAAGLVFHGATAIASVYRYGPPLAAPTFAPEGSVYQHASFAANEELWIWQGEIVGDFHGRHTVIEVPPRTVIDLWLYDANGQWLPWLDHLEVRPGDWNLDGAVNSLDISAYLADWARPAPPDWDGWILRGDYNLDGAVNAADVSAFITAWLGSL